MNNIIWFGEVRKKFSEEYVDTNKDNWKSVLGTENKRHQNPATKSVYGRQGADSFYWVTEINDHSLYISVSDTYTHAHTHTKVSECLFLLILSGMYFKKITLCSIKDKLKGRKNENRQSS